MDASNYYEIVSGDLLDAQEDLILQQTNCLAVRPWGLSNTIAERFPYADPYSKRRALPGRHIAVEEDRPNPGSILVLPAPVDDYDGPTVVALFSQYGTGVPYSEEDKPDSPPDSMDDRCRWFAECLEKVSALQPRSVALPYKIGCGMAGGDWSRYSAIINSWACPRFPDLRVVLYKLAEAVGEEDSEDNSSSCISDTIDAKPICAYGT